MAWAVDARAMVAAGKFSHVSVGEAANNAASRTPRSLEGCMVKVQTAPDWREAVGDRQCVTVRWGAKGLKPNL